MNHVAMNAATAITLRASSAELATERAPAPRKLAAYGFAIPGAPAVPHDLLPGGALWGADPMSLTLVELGGKRALDRAHALAIGDLIAESLSDGADELAATWRADSAH
jgi:hypothetical protein